MKKIFSKFIEYIVIIFSYIYNYENSRKIKYFSDRIYSIWLRRTFAYCGTDLMIQKPAIIRGGKYIKIGNNFFSNSRLRMECWDQYGSSRYIPEIIIGNNVSFNFNCHIGCINRIVIGDNVLFASNIFVSDHFHGTSHNLDTAEPPAKRELFNKGPVVIEKNVWVGENVVIMPGVTIGENSIIGANAVVTKSFPKNSVLAGVPATLIKS